MAAITEFIKRLFGLNPRHHVSAYETVSKALVLKLQRTGVQVGGGAGYPRVEVHSIIEGAPMDKEGMLRELSFTVESLSNRSLEEAAEMNSTNLELLTGSEIELTGGWTFVGIVPEQLQDIIETSDPQKVLYRILQTYRLYVEKVKTPDVPEDENEDENNGPDENTGDTENNS